jgi:hypothetical protein
LPATASAPTAPTKEKVHRDKKVDSSKANDDGKSEPGSWSEAPLPNSKLDGTSNVPIIGIDVDDASQIETIVENKVVASPSVPSHFNICVDNATQIVAKSDIVTSLLDPSIVENKVTEPPLVPLPSNTKIIVDKKQIEAAAFEEKTDISIELSDDSLSECYSCHDNHIENDGDLELDDDEPEYEIEVNCTDENASISAVFGSDYQMGYQVACIKYKSSEVICRCGMEFICALNKKTNKHIVFLQILKASEIYDENLVVVMAQGREVRNWLKKTGIYQISIHHILIIFS